MKNNEIFIYPFWDTGLVHYFGAFESKYKPAMPNIPLGKHTANIGGKSPFTANTNANLSTII
jgi:hypothetical protein